MVKANGYGHGAVAVAKTLAGAGSDAFGVATVEEGIELRRARIKQPILVLAGVYLEQLEQFLKNRLTPVIHEVATLKTLDQAAATTQGNAASGNRSRHRHGPHRFPDRCNRRLAASARQTRSGKTARGILPFLRCRERQPTIHSKTAQEFSPSIRPLGSTRKITHQSSHMAKSAAIITEPTSHFSMVRPGLILYGMYPATANSRSRSISSRC